MKRPLFHWLKTEWFQGYGVIAGKCMRRLGVPS
nr:MAG TPA: hypothetical protein [Caudoviricetes sp.]